MKNDNENIRRNDTAALNDSSIGSETEIHTNSTDTASANNTEQSDSSENASANSTSSAAADNTSADISANPDTAGTAVMHAKSKPNGRSFQTPLICICLALLLVIGVGSWQLISVNGKLTKVYGFINEYSGTDLSTWIASGAIAGNHPLYDDSDVVKAYKSGNSDGLSDKDAYVFKTASAAIDEIITEGMSDYEKEKAVYDWLFSQTHYNNSNFSAVSSTVTASDAGATAAASQDNAADKQPDSMTNADEKAAADEAQTDEGKAISSDSAASDDGGDISEASANDPIAQEDPYKESYDYEPYGVLKYHQYICVGNATTFKLFMDMLDIPCQIIHSTEDGEHAWNLVQLDGDWYHLDLTFDNGSNSPAYSNFNVPDDVKLDAGYPWDTTEFPAATASKYNYAVMNAQNVSDIYDLPSMVRKAIDDKQSGLYLTFDKSITVSADILNEILSSVTAYYPDSYFYASELTLGTDIPYFQIMLEIYDEGNIDEETAQQYLLDYDKLTTAINDAFGDIAVG